MKLTDFVRLSELLLQKARTRRCNKTLSETKQAASCPKKLSTYTPSNWCKAQPCVLLSAPPTACNYVADLCLTRPHYRAGEFQSTIYTTKTGTACGYEDGAVRGILRRPHLPLLRRPPVLYRRVAGNAQVSQSSAAHLLLCDTTSLHKADRELNIYSSVLSWGKRCHYIQPWIEIGNSPTHRESLDL